LAEIIHLFEYRVQPGFDAEVERFLRHVTAEHKKPAGLVARSAGRRLGRDQREYILGSIWLDEKSFAQGTDARGVPSCLAAKGGLLRDLRSSDYTVVAPAAASWAHAQILRVYRASVRNEDVAAWRQRAIEPIGRLSAKDGLNAVLAGFGESATSEPAVTPVIAITVWRDWESVLLATGGHLDRLLKETELGDLESPIDVEHYQLWGAEGD
jgi:hypothetical protein